MENIEDKIERIKKLIGNVSNGLDELNFDVFDTSFPMIVNEMKEVHVLRSQVIEEFGLENFLEYEPEIFSKAKLIENKFDNIVRVFSDEESRLEKELMGYAGAKKLINYKRYQNADQRNF
jgi:hypothetical protein